LQNCGPRWKEVEDLLKQVSGLKLRGTIFFVDWELNAQATKRLSTVIKILMDTGRIEEAWRVILMFKKPAMRLSLLNACSPTHRKLLTSSEDQKVCELRSRALTAAARAALLRHDLDEFFRLRPLLSEAAAASFLLPSLTPEDLGALDDWTLVAALHTALEFSPAMQTKARLDELHRLLSIAEKFEVHDPSRAATMKCMIWRALAKAKLLPPVEGHENPIPLLCEMALLPELTSRVLSGVPPDLLDEVFHVALEQIASKVLEPENMNFGSVHEAMIPIEFRANVAMERKFLIAQTLVHWDKTIDHDFYGISLWKAQQEFLRGFGTPEGENQFLQMVMGLLGSSPRSEHGHVLRVMVELLANSRYSDTAISLLTKLGSLSEAMNPELAESLRLQVLEAVNQLHVGDEARLPSLPQIKQEILKGNLQPSREKDDFDSALEEGDLYNAAALIRDSRDAAFIAYASEELGKKVALKLAEVAIFVRGQTEKIPEYEVDPGARAAVAQEMAAVLVISPEPYHTDLAARILSIAGFEPEEFIRVLLREKFGIEGHEVQEQIARALPVLCSPDHSLELDLILGTAKIRNMVAQVLIDELLRNRWPGATAKSLLKVLALERDVKLRSVLIHAIRQEAEQAGEMAAMQKASILQRIAIDLAMTGKRDDGLLAQRILLVTDEFGYVKSLRDQMVDLLRTLGSEANSVGLDLVLQTKQGQILIAQAVIDRLSRYPLVSAREVLWLFDVFAPRLDLGTAFPSPKALDTVLERKTAMRSLNNLSKALAG
jgi:hypothetical protein